MFNIQHFYLFLSVSILINLSPGPDMIYTAARSLSQGVRAGIFSALGIFAGCLFHITAAVFGLSAIIENSVLLFSIIKYAGAIYLVYLGVRSLTNKKARPHGDNAPILSTRKIFLQGMLTNMLNPKVAIFFLSFLPQFIDPQSSHLREQISFLGLWFDAQGTMVLMTVALLTGTFKDLLIRNGKVWNWQEKITGLILIGLGLRILISKK